MRDRLDQTAAILRSYNNKFVQKQVSNLCNAGIGKIIVVTDGNKDKGATRGFLGGFIEAGHVQLIEMHEGYSWANALNIGFKAVFMANVRERNRFRFVMNISVEAQFTRQHLEAMLDAAINDPKVGVVGTSFEGRQDGNIISLGRSYRHPRNTGMLVRIEAFGPLMGGFDARCDAIGGMEDIDFLLGMLALSEYSYTMLDLQVPLIVGANYHQPSKETREQEAMDKIVLHWRSLFPTHTDERQRIESAIQRMALDH